MEPLSESGLIFVAIISVLVFAFYIFRNLTNIRTRYVNILIFIIWLTLFGKTVRNDLANLIGNAILSISICEDNFIVFTISFL